MSDLAARFAQLAGEYEFRKRAATALVERWDWYSWPGLDLRPLHFERDLLKPGRRLDARPPVDRDVLRIGFDAQRRAVVIEEYSGFLHGRLYYETFVRHGGDVVEAAHPRGRGRSGAAVARRPVACAGVGGEVTDRSADAGSGRLVPADPLVAPPDGRVPDSRPTTLTRRAGSG